MNTLNELFVDFLNTTTEHSIRRFRNNNPHFGVKEIQELDTVKDIITRDRFITQTVFEFADFDSCSFINVIFRSSHFNMCGLSSCTFENCRFEKVSFTSQTIIDTKFINCFFEDVSFVSCDLLYSTIDTEHACSDVTIDSCFITEVLIQNMGVTNFIISNCITSGNSLTLKCVNINDGCFAHLDMRYLYLRSVGINDCMFINCNVGIDTIDKQCSNIKDSPNFIDLQTILHSDFSEHVYNMFGINSKADAKDYISAITKEIKFQSVFISYSFKDSTFARVLNEKIRSKGVNTFLWEHDAPGGRRLKKIMQEYIRKHDRVLFIASCNSLKSQACHFELSEARTIQDKEWKDVYYPIHIDDYLFKVQKDDIRPKEYRDEYWKNIEEILDFNSVSFCEYKDNYQNNLAFDEQVAKLVKDLKI